MKRDPDRDKIFFNNSIETVAEADASDNEKTYVSKASGPYCEHYKDIRVAVGSDWCRCCPMCYGHKIRMWKSDDSKDLSYNGYVSCAANNQTFINKIKCFWWRLTGRKSNIKFF